MSDCVVPSREAAGLTVDRHFAGYSSQMLRTSSCPSGAVDLTMMVSDLQIPDAL